VQIDWQRHNVDGFTACEWITVLATGVVCGGTLFRAFVNDPKFEFTPEEVGAATFMSVWAGTAASSALAG
jgi:hypothetical protein